MSALIWLGIVAVWGFVLIPMWLRHHDNALEQRSAERFTAAMRVLSRRGAARSARREAYALGAAGSGSGSGSGAGDGSGAGLAGAAEPVAGSAAQAGRVALMRARRQRLIVSLAAVPASLVVALVLGGMWFVVQVIVDVGLVGYVGYLRHLARSEQRLRASRAARDQRIAAARAAARAARPGYYDYGSYEAPVATTPSARRPTDAGRSTDAAARGVRYSTVAASAGRDGIASAETVDLSEVIAAARVVDAEEVGSYVVEHADEARAEGERAGGGEAAEYVEYEDEYDDEVDGEYAEGEYVEGEDADGEYTDGEAEETADPYRPPGRPTARRTRPSTSKPGRVQVNPPGTHGGLTAPPGEPAAASAPAASAPARRDDDPDDLDELLERHAAGA